MPSGEDVDRGRGKEMATRASSPLTNALCLVAEYSMIPVSALAHDDLSRRRTQRPKLVSGKVCRENRIKRLMFADRVRRQRFTRDI
jgi:hypothetical protein